MTSATAALKTVHTEHLHAGRMHACLESTPPGVAGPPNAGYGVEKHQVLVACVVSVARGLKCLVGTGERGVLERGGGVCLREHDDEYGHDLCQGPAHGASEFRVDLGAGVVIGASTGEHVFKGRVEKDNGS